MQKIRDEFIVAFEVEVADVEIDYAAARIGAVAQNIERAPVAFKQAAQIFLNDRQLHHFG